MMTFATKYGKLVSRWERYAEVDFINAMQC
jgi:hypothetical protein